MIYRLLTAMPRWMKQWIFAFTDTAMAPLALLLSVLLGASVRNGPADLSGTGPLAVAMAASALGAAWMLGLPRVKLNAYEPASLLRTLLFSAAVTAAGLLAARQLGSGLSFGEHVIAGLLLTVLAASWRIAFLHATLAIYRRGTPRLRVLIYGAGQTGAQLATALRHDKAVQPVAFVDDNPTLQSATVTGLRVHAPSRIPTLIRTKRIDRVILAMPSISTPALARIAQRLRQDGVEAQALPSFADLLTQPGTAVRDVTVPLDDLLGRTRLEAELPSVTHAYSGRRIMITGAGGSIGSELCRQLIACRPERIVLVEQSELALFEIEKELRALRAAPQLVPVLGSVLDHDLMRDVMLANEVEVVLHAAAYKHVPLVEQNPLAGLRNNVLGTKIIAEIARDCGAERFILVSSDKAVRPTNVMGASKRLAELVVQDLALRASGTRFSMVRFGNVLRSSGSVIPLFEEQIARGGPVTLTHRDVTRFFMTVAEAARLTLLAGSFARGGDVFVLDMGAPVPIHRLARQMIEGAGYTVRDPSTPNGDIEIRVTGLRPGEKLHEELLISPDMLTTPHPKILRAQENFLSEFETATVIKDLRDAIASRDESAARALIRRWVEQGEQPETVAPPAANAG